MAKTLNVDLSKVKITFIRFEKEATELAFRVPTKDGTETFRTNRPSPPHPDLILARDSLVPHLLRLCEIPEDDEREVRVTSVNFKWKEGTFGAVITGTRRYAKSFGVLVLNSPVKYDDVELDELKLPDDTLKALMNLHAEAIEFIGGKSGQGDLFVRGDGALESAEPAAKAPKAEAVTAVDPDDDLLVERKPAARKKRTKK